MPEGAREGRGDAGSGCDETSVGIWSGLSAGASLNCVATSSVEITLPHEEQNRARGGTSTWQELQRAIGKLSR